MKKYLQSCGFGGASFYGKKGQTARTGNFYARSSSKRGDLASAYNKFYKEQFETMSKLFRRTR